MKRMLSMFVLASMLILSSVSLVFADSMEEGIIIDGGLV